MTGAGELVFPGHSEEVGYRIAAAAVPRAGAPAVRGSLETTPETARALFKAGRGELKLEGGKACRITVLAHSEGSGTAYFEATV
ncbi:MAG TPA: hypothetical protein VD929_09460 [Caulobacteraceae bacterium]|nr:hypothetical protein [Caulobacteraceae bacterium]